mmetsp:Transcript_17316/g.43163  ORF Transcript_17316/g.43163 Transcript_17316/m.43163 type:complete len:205 (+) Transcript_17316:557-1171(+)
MGGIPVQCVQAGNRHTAVLSTAGDVYVGGSNVAGQLSDLRVARQEEEEEEEEEEKEEEEGKQEEDEKGEEKEEGTVEKKEREGGRTKGDETHEGSKGGEENKGKDGDKDQPGISPESGVYPPSVLEGSKAVGKEKKKKKGKEWMKREIFFNFNHTSLTSGKDESGKRGYLTRERDPFPRLIDLPFDIAELKCTSHCTLFTIVVQ